MVDFSFGAARTDAGTKKQQFGMLRTPQASRQSSLAAGFGLADPSSGKLKHWDQLLQAGCA
jgi:hypothetical protein